MELQKPSATPTWKIVGAWAIVMVPFIWGIYKSLNTAVALFFRQ